ncbi:hypothetical protein Dimus_021619 [Dionaea muscipula]
MESSTNRRKKNPQKPCREIVHVRRRKALTSSSSSSSSSWCCSFKSPPMSPESLSVSSFTKSKTLTPKPTKPTPKSVTTSFPSSPQSAKSALGLVGRIGPRRILSPGRVSPIDSDPTSLPDISSPDPTSVSNMSPDPAPSKVPAPEGEAEARDDEGKCSRGGGGGGAGAGGGGLFDVRLNLKGKRGGRLALELNSGVLGENSPVFADLIDDFRRKNEGCMCRIEVPEVESLGVFRETIELMFEDDIIKRLLKIGVYRAIDVLEVSASIKFNRCIMSCLKYLEAVPWTEDEEEKMRRLFTKLKFDDATTHEILARLDFPDHAAGPGPGRHQSLSGQLLWSITACENAKARNELKSLVKGLLCRSSVYEKEDHLNLDIKEDLYSVCRCCLSSLVTLFEESSSSTTTTTPRSPPAGKKGGSGSGSGSGRPLVESISWQVDNITWLLELLLEHQMAEEFVDMWADQKELIRMHGLTSPLVRYELSRVSAVLFAAMGTRKLHCGTCSRSGLLHSWFSPMLSDFGWLRRCRKGLDIRQLEEAMGQALLTLPLKQQCELFMEWFRCFSKHGTDCPNLSKAFQVWWRRTSSLRGGSSSETHAGQSR